MRLTAALLSLAALIRLWGCVSSRGVDCDDGGLYGPAGAYNAAARTNLVFSPFGRAETGWAGRFGFVNYPFEPWHWEWTGATP